MSKRVKHEFSRYEFSREMLVSIGQMTHAVTSRMQIWSAGYKVRSITPLEREVALSRGAEFVGEAFVFTVAGGVVVWEYNKSKEKEMEKEMKRHNQVVEEAERLQAKLNALDARLVALEEVVKANSESIFHLGKKKYVEPKAKAIAIDDGRGKIDKTISDPPGIPAVSDKSPDGDETVQSESDGQGASNVPHIRRRWWCGT